MYRLITLGGADLIGPGGGAVRSVVKQPKRFALLVYLALTSRNRPVRRDRLRGVFWSEMDEEAARKALNQALYHLRRSLGPAAVLSRGTEEVQLDPAVVSCDAAEFEALLEAKRRIEAFEVYGGELLPGFFLDGCHEFERWLEERRSHLARLAAEAATALVKVDAASGNVAGAAHWARRAAALYGPDELAVRRLIELVDSAGDGSGALAIYEQLARRLREDLELQPSAETRALVDAIRAREKALRLSAPPAPVDAGARNRLDSGLAASRGQAVRVASRRLDPAAALHGARAAQSGRSTRAAPDAQGTVGERTSAEHGGPLGRPRRRMAFFATLLASAAVGVWTLLPLGRGAEPTAPPPEQPVVMLLPFKDFSGNGGLEHLARAISTALASRLAEPAGIEVVAFPDDLQGMPLAAGLGPARGTESAGSHGFLVHGGVTRSGDRLRVDVHLATSSGRVLRSGSMEHAWGEAASLVDEVTADVGAFVRREIGRELRLRERRAGTESARARDLVQRAEEIRADARRLRVVGDGDAAEAGFEQADSLLQLAELEAPGWIEPVVLRARIAADAAWLEAFGRQDAEAARRLFEEALAHVNRALATEPRAAHAFELRGTLNYWLASFIPMNAVAAAELLRKAEKDYRQAVALEPGRLRAWSDLGSLLLRRGDFPGARLALIEAYRSDVYLENIEENLLRLFEADFEIGDDRGALRWCDELERRISGTWPVAYCKLAFLAWSADAQTALTTDAWEIIERHASGKRLDAFVSRRLEVLAASVLARAGLPDSAEAVFSRARDRLPDDPELLHLEADLRQLLGQADSAALLMAQYVTERPVFRWGTLQSRRFGKLARHDAIRAIRNPYHWHRVSGPESAAPESEGDQTVTR